MVAATIYCDQLSTSASIGSMVFMSFEASSKDPRRHCMSEGEGEGVREREREREGGRDCVGM